MSVIGRNPMEATSLREGKIFFLPGQSYSTGKFRLHETPIFFGNWLFLSYATLRIEGGTIQVVHFFRKH